MTVDSAMTGLILIAACIEATLNKQHPSILRLYPDIAVVVRDGKMLAYVEQLGGGWLLDPVVENCGGGEGEPVTRRDYTEAVEAIWNDASDNDWLHLIEHLEDEAIRCILAAHDAHQATAEETTTRGTP